MKQEPLRMIDLFSGAGGLTLGFTRLSGNRFEPVWANDICPHAAATYNANFGTHCFVGDIERFLEDREHPIPAADLVIGGPPCQGFSLLNKQRRGDSRKRLWRSFLEVVRRSGASAFVMENVPHILGTEEHRQIEQEALSLGFSLSSTILCAADFGVSQKRFRAFIIGCSFCDPASTFPPKRTHFDPKKAVRGNGFSADDYIDNPNPWKTVRDVIADLAAPRGTEIREIGPPLDLHFGRKPTEMSKKRYRAIPKEGMNRFDLERIAPELTPECWKRKKSGGTDLFGRLWWDQPAFTIRTEFFKPEKGRYLHPKQHRPITHREAARLQSFPDDFVFTGSKTEIAKQIGNAVPPLLAAKVAESVLALFDLREAAECPTFSTRRSAVG
ncbi:MAG: DNA cytosine methyltransferase [Candidatus Geothermincolia bacterium]